MEHATEKVESLGREENSEILPAVEVQKALTAILQSTPFHSSKQSQQLLQFIVDQTLAGHFEMLKERIIGANVFGRRPDYDTNDDPVVRSRAAEVRKRLAVYYQIADQQVVRISIPSGSFRAAFERLDKKPSLPASITQPGPEIEQPPAKAAPLQIVPTDAEPGLPQPSKGLGMWRWLILAAAAILLLGLASQRFFVSPEERAFNRFWSPVLDKSNPVLIYIGSNAVYELSGSYVDAYRKLHPPSKAEEMGLESYIPLPPGGKIDTDDLYPAKDTFVTIGDVAAITRIVTLLVHRDKQFDVRYGTDLVFSDLRQSPTVLIGAHNNLWTIAMTDNLRFVFNSHMSIQDRSDPQKHWSANSDFTEDYAIVSRILNSKTGTTIVTAAGIGHAGTRAAAEFLTNPAAIAALVKTLPKDWEKKNTQIVLHTSVTNQIPSPADVVDTYCW